MGKSKVFFIINVDICVEKDGDGYHAFCPSFKGLHTDGATLKETLSNARNALVAYVLSLLKHHEPIPCCRIIREESVEERKMNVKYYNENIAIPECVS